jgi:hypothetical protein
MMNLIAILDDNTTDNLRGINVSAIAVEKHVHKSEIKHSSQIKAAIPIMQEQQNIQLIDNTSQLPNIITSNIPTTTNKIESKSILEIDSQKTNSNIN